MKHYKFVFNIAGKRLTVWAIGPVTAKILAQAEAIKRGWDYTACVEVSK